MNDFGAMISDDKRLTLFLRDFGVSLIGLGWPVEEADRALRYVRGAGERGERLGDALAEVWKMHGEGKLVPKEAE